MVTILNHPLITHKLTQMRKIDTKTKDFKQNLDEIAGLMAYEVCRDLPLKPVHITTPVAECDTYELLNDIRDIIETGNYGLFTFTTVST